MNRCDWGLRTNRWEWELGWIWIGESENKDWGSRLNRWEWGWGLRIKDWVWISENEIEDKFDKIRKVYGLYR